MTLPTRFQLFALVAAVLAIPIVSGEASADRSRPLNPPTALNVTAATNSSLTLSWQGPYGLQVRWETYVNGSKVATGVHDPSFTFSDLTCGTSYSLGVDAYTISARSRVVSLTGTTSACTTPPPPPPPPSDTTPPTAPTGLHVQAATSTSVTVGWAASTDDVGVAGYDAYIGDAKDGTSATSSYSFTNLTCGSTFVVGVDAYDAAGNRSGLTQTSVSTSACPAPSATGGAATTANRFVSPQGSDANPCTQAAPCASLDRAYQRAAAGDTVLVAAGTYPDQVIKSRYDLRNQTPGCSVGATAQCVHFVGTGVQITGSLEIHGAGIWIDGGPSPATPGFDVTGYIDTEGESSASYPDHVIVQGTHSSSFGVFNTDTVTFKAMDVGPATVTSGCVIQQGPGIENKIGFAGGVTVVPTNVTLDGLVIHDQNGDSGRIASDCHFGGLFLVTANGLTIKNTVFQKNVVYNVQIQNFGGAPAPTNVTFSNNSFGCPVDWLYNGAPCDGQASIQFDGTFPGIDIVGNKFAGGDYGCYAGTCSYDGNAISGNTLLPPSTTAPPLG